MSLLSGCAYSRYGEGLSDTWPTPDIHDAPPFPMPVESHSLSNSNLVEAEAAGAALFAGWTVEPLGEQIEVTDALVRIYAARAGVVAERGDSWRRLAASTDELADNLAKSLGKQVQWQRIIGPQGETFLCCQTAEDGVYIGCLFVQEAGAEATLNP